MSLKNQIASHLCSAIRSNVEDLYAGRIEHAAFTQAQRSAWDAAEYHEVTDLLRSMLLDHAIAAASAEIAAHAGNLAK